jgi:hypothetical protein
VQKCHVVVSFIVILEEGVGETEKEIRDSPECPIKNYFITVIPKNQGGVAGK